MNSSHTAVPGLPDISGRNLGNLGREVMEAIELRKCNGVHTMVHLRRNIGCLTLFLESNTT
jgi:hypothetical protein